MQTKIRLGFWLIAVTATLGSPALAQGGGRFCTATATAQYDACGLQNASDYLIAKAKCINESDEDEREACGAEAKEGRNEQAELCGDQRERGEGSAREWERADSTPTSTRPISTTTFAISPTRIPTSRS